VVAPADPGEAQDADVADPGEVQETKARQRELKQGKYGTAKVKPAKQGSSSKGKKGTWIEIELLDDKGKPVPGEAYQVTLPDGETVAGGTLNDKGFARVEGIDPGTCSVTFPDLDKDAWKRA
jgi:type VI secretion system secreted protein VgrG